jgi:hypothetical protein
VGGGLMLGRKWLTLDFGSGSLVRSRGLLIPMQSEERHFSEFSAVVIAFQAGDSDSADRYPVRLRALTGKDFDISSPTQFAESRKLAEYLSRAVRLPLADAITDHETIAPPERAADPLRERLRSAGPQEERAMPPSGMRSEVSTSRGYASIVIPVARVCWLEEWLVFYGSGDPDRDPRSYGSSRDQYSTGCSVHVSRLPHTHLRDSSMIGVNLSSAAIGKRRQ